MRNNSEKPKPFAKKSFGQNFLVDENYIGKIIGALKPEKDEIVVEIGAGRGALTEKLVGKTGKTIAVELDRDLIPELQKKFGRRENFQLIERDALKIDFEAIAEVENRKLKLVANLPYYISTAILQKLIEQRAAFSEMVLMFQREVVRRIAAAPNDSERGYLTVLVEAHLETEKLFDVPPQAFRPAPKVWSSIIRLTPKENSAVETTDERHFRQIVSVGFAQKRKTILNNLKHLPPEMLNKFGTVENLLIDCEIDSKRRAETLTVAEWKKLAGFCNSA